ncbi:hypothetical protein L6452_01336 [Arctium lappa]|uniref:Uncharacterized protein n=1 Tax=Arctium lappa TaxID=4217 RepID=A0ACB9FGU4_ARCLA|nr:hypothetical protein L6452_01336 [Arctium lappa]
MVTDRRRVTTTTTTTTTAAAAFEQVKVLSLTDHDTMVGIPQALEAAQRVGINIIHGVEVSTIFTPRTESGSEEPFHVLAYYSSCGPTNFEKLDQFLANIREGRYLRSKNMISKLNKLKLPLRWENVEKIAGVGVAPGRLARCSGSKLMLKKRCNWFVKSGVWRCWLIHGR